jgi:hypothetical protein
MGTVTLWGDASVEPEFAQTARRKFIEEKLVVGVGNCLHPYGQGSRDVLGAVVDKEDSGRRGTEPFGSGLVDGGGGLGHVEGMRPDAEVETQ